MQDTRPLLIATDFPAIRRHRLDTLQVNLGYRCNLSCVHCHVNAGPQRSEEMDKQTIDALLRFIGSQGISTLDITGGAPEMNPHFEYLVKAARQLGVTVIDRCNLTILLEPGYEHLTDFLAEQQVVVTASLPCYLEENVEQQRGKGVYTKSIEALQRLNACGYGVDADKPLNLVYNPTGASLPPPQAALEQDYKQFLHEQFGIRFNDLLTLTNMPISRFGAILLAQGELDSYLQLLRDNFSAANLESVMCKHLISVDWQGYVYDCDFNQMLDLPLHHQGDNLLTKDRVHINDLMAAEFQDLSIKTGEHCYGCTAGQGSSCGGALSG